MSLSVISTFSLTDPGRQPELLSRLQQDALDVLGTAPGFEGSTLSASDDGTTVIHQALWASEGDLAAMLASGPARATMLTIRSLATVEVVRSHQVIQIPPAAVTELAEQPKER